MNRPELRVFLSEWFCGCGNPEDAAGFLLELLQHHPLYEPTSQAWLRDNLPVSGSQYLVLYTLDRFELTEHGGSVGGGWLTDKGKVVMAALKAEEADEFEALFADHCACGYDLDDQDHDCYPKGGGD